MHSLRSFLFVLVGLFGSVKLQAQLDAKHIAANYYKGVVKILLYDSAAEKKQTGAGYIGRGSGFIVNPEGVVFTNRHVIEFCVYGYAEYDYLDRSNGEKVRIFDAYSADLRTDPDVVNVLHTGFATPIIQVYHGQGEKDYKLYRGEVLTLGTGSFDGAMLKIVSDMNGNKVADNFFSLPLGNSDKTQQGEDLCVFGFPAQYDGNIDLMIKDLSTLTFGKLSGYDYVFNKDYGYIKTDASINSGNSGGPVFNESNKVIGIATATGNKTNIGLVGGVNGMYYVVAPESTILKDLIKRGLSIPDNAGSIKTITGKRVSILSAEEINKQRPKASNVSKNKNLGKSKSKDNDSNSKVGSVSSGYYRMSKITFVDHINDDGSLGNRVPNFIITDNNNGIVYIDVDNYPKALKADKFIIDIFIKEGNDFRKIDTQILPVNPSVKASYFKYQFTKGGEFKFAIYNQDEVWINNGFISVTTR